MIMIKKTYPITETLLTQGYKLNQELLSILEREAEKLNSRQNAATIAQLAEQKKRVSQQLEQFSLQLTQILATESLELNASGIQHYFIKAKSANLPIKEGLEIWQKMTQLIKRCQQLNEQNGASIALLMRHNQRIQQIFRGKNQFATTYTAKGSTTAAHFSRAIASA